MEESPHLISSCPVSSSAIVLTDLENKVIAASPSAERLFSGSTIVGRDWNTLVATDSSDVPNRNVGSVRLMRVLAPEEDAEEDTRFIQVCMHQVETDGIAYSVWFLEDITDVRDLSRAIEVDSEDTNVRNVETPPPTETIVLRLNSFGRIVQAFPMTQFLGHDTESLLNRFIMRFVAPDDVAELCRGLSRACRPYGYAVFMVRWTWSGTEDGRADGDLVEGREGSVAVPADDEEEKQDFEMVSNPDETITDEANADEVFEQVNAYMAARARSRSIGLAPELRPHLSPTFSPENVSPHDATSSASPLEPPLFSTATSVPQSPRSTSRSSSIADPSTPLPTPPPSPSKYLDSAVPSQLDTSSDPVPTWVHFTVGPCPSTNPDEEEDEGTRNLLCLIQVVRANTGQDIDIELAAADAAPSHDEWFLTLRNSVKKWTSAAGEIVQFALWVIWRVMILPKMVVGRVGGMIFRCL
ncbi:uncharacterized protein SPPG_08797 [Spizellomyces punctatus DAOM BR117]|uniref:PAS domain-containing protein n=1 Tax=Spizellomyces punctatus (strain DAOM BR117) TaxID=645134 RepID=A0A0L0H2X7_SPIPD|nr:uncharacterized protein SPPG_08797 [Spizellomyces punctatus DAOM BR117]KNC95805.1 hypothetical protein SPPG_08797 [Spizellomyces punctatus DAOM BR117]|eukprot:XP_016603845.1 hypothetical protein SPPG_08797 [Spizellomyces punctatus DAOM BR117]